MVLAFCEKGGEQMKQSNQKDRLVHALSAGKDGAELVNVKFFLGDRRNVTQEEICAQAANALTQVNLGMVKPLTSVDCEIGVISISQFLR